MLYKTHTILKGGTVLVCLADNLLLILIIKMELYTFTRGEGESEKERKELKVREKERHLTSLKIFQKVLEKSFNLCII